MSVKIITDSASDLPASRHPAISVLPMTITFGEESFLDGVELDHHRFYEKLIEGEDLPTIDGTPPNLFNEVKGDAFAPRNRQALAIDFEEEPPYFAVSETHMAKTWYLDPRSPKIEQPKSIRMLREKMKR